MSANGNVDSPETNGTSTITPGTEQTRGPGTSSGDGCANCGSTADWGHSSWCPRCGWYPALKTCVEVDGAEDERAEDERPLQWWQIIPLWGLILGAGVVGLGALSVFARVTTSVASGDRGMWAIIQLTVGIFAFLGGHLWAYIYAVLKSSDFGPLDIITKPVALWSPSTRELPSSFPRFAMAIWGLTAALLAVTVIGGIRYSALFDDWGFEEQAQTNLVHEITKMAREAKEEGADSLEGAMNDFTGDEEAVEEPVPEDQIELDCLIIGYTGEKAEEFGGLVLAAMIRGKLRYIGIVTEDISPEMHAELAAEMKSLGRERSFVKTKFSAHWLKPKLMCRVTSGPLKNGTKLKDPAFKERLADAE